MKETWKFWCESRIVCFSVVNVNLKKFLKLRNYLFGAFDKLLAMQHRPWTQCSQSLFLLHKIQEENIPGFVCFLAFSTLGLSQVRRECLLLLESTFVTEICQDARKWFTTLLLKIYSQLLPLSHLSNLHSHRQCWWWLGSYISTLHSMERIEAKWIFLEGDFWY